MEELGVRDEEPRRAQGGAVVQRMLKSLRESRTRTGGRELIPKPRKELGRKGSSPRSQSAVPSLQPSLWLQAAEVRGVEVEAQAEVGDPSLATDTALVGAVAQEVWWASLRAPGRTRREQEAQTQSRDGCRAGFRVPCHGVPSAAPEARACRAHRDHLDQTPTSPAEN